MLNCLFELLYNSKVKRGRWSKLGYKLFKMIEPKRRKCANSYNESIINVEA